MHKAELHSFTEAQIHIKNYLRKKIRKNIKYTQRAYLLAKMYNFTAWVTLIFVRIANKPVFILRFMLYL